MLLSVVIVARNEEKNIARCIESVLRETEHMADIEILLSDSASKDRTIEIAKRYPINIIQLKSDWLLSPSAGRFSGVNNVTGEYVLIIDGDMELLSGWTKKALEFLGDNKSCAAVMAKSYNIYLEKDGFKKIILDRYAIGKEGGKEISYVQQSSFFRRRHLVDIGNFQPFLRAEEEAEISFRLRRKGYSLYFLDYNSIHHYRPCSDPFKESMRRLKGGLFPGMGDMFSWCLRKGYVSILWERFKVFFLFMGMSVCAVMGFLVFLFLRYFVFAMFIVLLPVYFFVFQCIKKGGVRQGIISFLNIALISLSLFKGLFKKVPEISDYSNDVLWIKKV